MSDRTILGITDLKRVIIYFACGTVGLAIVAFQYHQSQITAAQVLINSNFSGDAKQDLAIADLKAQISTADATGKRLEDAVKDQRTLTSQMLIQMTQLSGKVSSTEEISRNTQSRIEALNDYLRNERMDPKRSVLDSSEVRKRQGYVEP